MWDFRPLREGKEPSNLFMKFSLAQNHVLPGTAWECILGIAFPARLGEVAFLTCCSSWVPSTLPCGASTPRPRNPSWKACPMHSQQFARLRWRFTALVTFLITAVLLWKHGHGGVPRHHLLHRADLPAISCWWDLVVVPALSWWALLRARVRLVQPDEAGSVSPKSEQGVLLGFAGALAVGLLLAMLFEHNQESILGQLINGIFLVALFAPVYRTEYLLGFVLGMTFTFGAVLPLGFGSVLALAGAILFRGVRPLMIRIGRWIYGV